MPHWLTRRPSVWAIAAFTSSDRSADVDAIRMILITDWDPIGCGVPDDEYDCYIGAIFALMQRQVSAEELAQHLEMIETRTMCLQSNADRNRRVAKSLLEIIK
jgi:hypothetical protein